MKQAKLPQGWDEARVERVRVHYESQTPEQAVAEDEEAWEDRRSTFIEIPNELLPAVRRMIAVEAARGSDPA